MHQQPHQLLVGRLEPIKRVDRFLRVANLIEEPGETRFLVVGDGTLREKLQQYRTKQTDNVRQQKLP